MSSPTGIFFNKPSLNHQGGLQASALFVSIVMGVISGLIAGFIASYHYR